MEDYGRAAFDVRNRVFVGGTISLPYAFRLSPFIIANSGSPFNIIVGQDLNGDSIFNDRPALASRPPGRAARSRSLPTAPSTPCRFPGSPSLPSTTAPGTSVFSLNLRLSKTIGLGPKVEGRTGGGRPAWRRRRRRPRRRAWRPRLERWRRSRWWSVHLRRRDQPQVQPDLQRQRAQSAEQRELRAAGRQSAIRRCLGPRMRWPVRRSRPDRPAGSIDLQMLFSF